MGLACLFGHKWDGCKCTRCGATRDVGHDWNGCKCSKCGILRDEGHVYQYTFIDEKHCEGKCTQCGKTIQQGHQYQTLPGGESMTCKLCGHTKKMPMSIEKRGACKPEDILIFGKWQNQPLTWKVLAVESDRLLLITENLLGCRAYHTSRSATWDKSQLRTDLNGAWFLENPSVFTPQERNLILTVTNDSPGIYYQNKRTWEEHYTNKGDTAEDKVFLLSVIEASKYFHADGNKWMSDVMGYRTYEFPASDALAMPKPWWLRNATRKGDAAVVITTDGIINYQGFTVTEGTIPQVRPAVWISK